MVVDFYIFFCFLIVFVIVFALVLIQVSRFRSVCWFLDIDVCVSVLYITSICVQASFYCTGLVGFDVCV